PSSRPISRSRRRKFVLDVSLSRILVSLCCTKGWLTTWIECGKDMIFSPISEHGAVAGDGDRRPTPGAPFGGKRAACEPGACLQDFYKRKAHGIEAEMGAHGRGNAVEQRHGQRPPFDDGLVADGKGLFQKRPLLGPKRARIDQQSAVAVLGQTGELVDLDDLQARALQTLDQRGG